METIEAPDYLVRLIGVAIAIVPACYFAWRPRSTRNWPRARARLIKIRYDDHDGLVRRFWRAQYGEDYGIEYEVEGRKYLQIRWINTYTRLGRLRAKSIPLVPNEFEVRYRADNPDKYSVIHVYPRWYVWVVTTICATVGLLIAVWP
jgi:hypothetical protein